MRFLLPLPVALSKEKLARSNHHGRLPLRDVPRFLRAAQNPRLARRGPRGGPWDGERHGRRPAHPGAHRALLRSQDEHPFDANVRAQGQASRERVGGAQWRVGEIDSVPYVGGGTRRGEPLEGVPW